MKSSSSLGDSKLPGEEELLFNEKLKSIMKIIHHATSAYKPNLIDLYKATFPSSITDTLELNNYIDSFLNDENAYLAIDNEVLTGALLYSPLSHDKDLPTLIVENFKSEDCVYVAEMMVNENSRGKGIGTYLLTSFLKTIDKKTYTDAFIRVWDQNQVAIGLYKKLGFRPYTQIDQVKKRVDGTGTYLMKKIYLHKKL